MLPALGAEHGMRAENIEMVGENLQENVLRELLHRQNVDEESVPPQALQRQRPEHGLHRYYGGAYEYNIGMLLAEIVRIGEESGAERLRDGVVIGARVGKDGVALADERLREELSEVSEPDDGDFELAGLAEAVEEVGLVVVGLRGVDCADAVEAAAAARVKEVRRGRGRE